MKGWRITADITDADGNTVDRLSLSGFPSMMDAAGFRYAYLDGTATFRNVAVWIEG